LKNETQHLYNVIGLGCASLNPTYEYNIKALLKKSGIIYISGNVKLPIHLENNIRDLNNDVYLSS
jgi:hypothetical protein